MMAETALIIGLGEVGKALSEVLGAVHHLMLIDLISEPLVQRVDVMHICFPYNDKFIDEVRRYQALYEPPHTVIHSTVPPGTSERCGACHSPVIGIHPHMAESLRTFTKFIGGPDASNVADHFRAAGMRVYLFDDARTTELMKILSTTFYAVCIEYAKDVKRLCRELGVPFEAWTLWTDNYNAGYGALGHAEYTRPNLVPVERTIGGHCCLPNCELLETDFTELVKRRNKR